MPPKKLNSKIDEASTDAPKNPIKSTGTKKTIKLDHSRLKGELESGGGEKGAIRSIIVLTLVVILVALGSIYFLKNFNLPTNNEPVEETEEIEVTETPTPTPTPTVTKKIEPKSELKPDSEAEYAPTEEEYTDENITLDNKTNTEYTLKKISLQPYETFYRVMFEFMTNEEDSKSMTPKTETNYLKTPNIFEISFAKVVSDSSDYMLDKEVELMDSVVNLITKIGSSEDDTVAYRLNFDESTQYYLHAEEEYIVLDIQELEPRTYEEESDSDEDMKDEEEIGEEEEGDMKEEEDEEDMNEEEDEDVEKDEEEPTPTPTKVSTPGKKEISSDETGLVAGVKQYAYDDYSDRFEYHLKLSNEKIPNVKSSASSGKVVFTVENLVFDGIAGTEYGNVDFSAEGVKDVLSVSSKFSEGKSSYEFEIESGTKYDVKLDDTNFGEKRIIFSFYH